MLVVECECCNVLGDGSVQVEGFLPSGARVRMTSTCRSLAIFEPGRKYVVIAEDESTYAPAPKPAFLIQDNVVVAEVAPEVALAEDTVVGAAGDPTFQ